MGDTREIGSRLELFVDDWLIDRMSGTSLKLHHPAPQETALDFDRPWEGSASWAPIVIKENDRYRLWYRAWPEGGKAREAYAESADGVHWERPSLGIVEFEGSKDNNLIWTEPGGNMNPFLDANPAATPDQRYKAIVRSKVVHALASPDGTHWSLIREEPVLTDGPFDSPNVAFWDTNREEYVVYTRGVAGEGNFKGGVRWIRRATSKDFMNWTSLELIDPGETPYEHLYTNACTQYYRAPHIYLMFPKRFVPERTFDADWFKNGISEAVFMSSRDGSLFDRRFMQAFIRPGPDPRNWTDRNTIVGVGVVPTSDTEISLYYVENYQPPSDRLRRATLRIDGFVSVNASYAGGELTTRPLTFEGGELVINYATSVAGGIRVEVQEADGKAIDGHLLPQSADIFGDEIERVVAWDSGTDVSALAGRPVRLRFTMKDADLYSIRFR